MPAAGTIATLSAEDFRSAEAEDSYSEGIIDQLRALKGTKVAALVREVQQYTDSVHRRFLVKPGITGLWQVSGRSDLDWEETVRLDLFYVENWTMTGDLVILFKTVRAVVGSDGAY